MRAVRFHDYTGVDAVQLDEIDCPAPGPGDLVVRVLAAGVNPFDRYAVEGWVNAFVSFTLPAVLGRDFSGIVNAVGSDVTEFVAGDAVYGHVDASSDGSFADFVVVPAHRVVAKPAGLSHVEVASLPNVLMAAWDGLYSTETGADLKAGQTILIHGAAGGIGSLAVQLAKWSGAHTIGTASPPNLPFLQTLGVDTVLDYTDPNWMGRLPKIDAVLDTSPGMDADRLVALLSPGGRYIALRNLPPAPWADLNAQKGIRCTVASGPASASNFSVMTGLVAEGAVRPVVTEILPLENVHDALRQIGTGHVRGKLVLAIADA